MKLFSVGCIGTKVIPCDFIAPVETHNPLADGLHHEVCVIAPSMHQYYITTVCVCVCVCVICVCARVLCDATTLRT